MNAPETVSGKEPKDRACYRKLHRYKYQLMRPYVHSVPFSGFQTETDYLRLRPDGELEVKRSYAWDGPSGPTVDTRDFMRGSLVHDALYQLIRLEVLLPSHRRLADRELRAICRQDGMSAFRAWYVYAAVRLFGASSARPGTDKPDRIICVPANRR